MVGYICLTQFDFGPMLKAQKRAEQTGKTIRDGGVPMRSTVEVKLPEGVEPKAISVVVPLAIMLITMFTIFFSQRFSAEKHRWYRHQTGHRIGLYTRRYRSRLYQLQVEDFLRQSRLKIRSSME